MSRFLGGVDGVGRFLNSPARSSGHSPAGTLQSWDCHGAVQSTALGTWGQGWGQREEELSSGQAVCPARPRRPGRSPQAARERRNPFWQSFGGWEVCVKGKKTRALLLELVICRRRPAAWERRADDSLLFLLRTSPVCADRDVTRRPTLCTTASFRRSPFHQGVSHAPESLRAPCTPAPGAPLGREGRLCDCHYPVCNLSSAATLPGALLLPGSNAWSQLSHQLGGVGLSTEHVSPQLPSPETQEACVTGEVPTGRNHCHSKVPALLHHYLSLLATPHCPSARPLPSVSSGWPQTKSFQTSPRLASGSGDSK